MTASLLLLATLLTAGPAAAADPPISDREALHFFAPLPKSFASARNPSSEEKIQLGRMLFYDPRLSKNQDVSCNSCHALEGYGVDNRKFSQGHRKQLGGRNSPSVYNTGGHIAQFWDGRAENLEAQAKGPVLNPVEMAMPDATRVVAVLRSIPGYVTAFRKAYPKERDPVSFENMARAIGVFERQLVTPSRFDRFLDGDSDALTLAEKSGLLRFITTGCVSCHNGAAVGGASFQRLGLVNAFPDQSDLGRVGVTRDEEDRMKFRVPSLRNVEKTGPWFHNGSLVELEVVVKTMAHHQLGVELKDAEAAEIVTFLKSLTGELPMPTIAKPELPASGPKTPKADPR